MAAAAPAKDGVDTALLNEKTADLKISDTPDQSMPAASKTLDEKAPTTGIPQTDATADAVIKDASTESVPAAAVVGPQTDATADAVINNSSAETAQAVAATIPQTDATSDAVIIDASAGPSQAELAPQGVTKIPIPAPLPACKPAPTPELSEAETKKYDELLATVSAWTAVPKTENAGAETEPISDRDRLFLTREQLLRYLRATKWDVSAASKRLLATLTWRREYGIDGFTHDYISPENETGKQVIEGFDKEGRPCLYLNPSKQNTERSPRQLEHLFYNVERVIDLMGPGQESLALLINFADTRKGQGATIQQSKMTLYVLQNHYPERLGRALITELPWYITVFFKMINPFIDPHTRTKIKFNEAMTTYVPAEQLLKQFGGNVEFEYDHATYWPALDALCSRKRKDYVARWEKAGKRIGEHEGYLKGGDVKSLNGAHVGTQYGEGFAAST